MKTFSKVALSVGIFLLTFIAVSAVCLTTFFNNGTYCFDKDSRAVYAGKIDRLFCGTSYAQGAYVPNTIDPVLDCFSYNLSGPAMPVSATAELLRVELERNPINTVYIDISLNSFTRESDSGEGEMYALPRFDGLGGKLAFLRRVDLPTYSKLYSNMMLQGLIRIKSYISYGIPFAIFNKYDSVASPYFAEKGYCSHENGANNVIPEDEIESQRDIYRCSTYVDEDYFAIYDEIISMCREHGAKVVFVVTPLTEANTWVEAGADDAFRWFIDYCEENGCEFYDFCLLKERHELLSDEDSFIDDVHMCRNAAERFSARFAEIMALAESGEDVSDLFCSSYAEYKEMFPYTLYYEESEPVSASDAA